MNNSYLLKSKAVFTNYAVRIWKWGLQKYFHFDKWHIVSLRQRKYARDIINFCNGLTNKSNFLEIGCGLGDIIRNVHFINRVGHDSDQRVLNAASFLNKISLEPRIRFSLFHFPDSDISGKYDVILLVNWIHHIEPYILKSKIEEYYNDHLLETGSLILDTVQHPEYRYNHDVGYLTKDTNARVIKLGDYERQRQVWLITKN
jgi:2-polyprenyl-3-methyl-5-hydroxy-6-metoxy-1,4-benzoquinol methylase